LTPAAERRLAPDELERACRDLLADGGRMQMAWGWFPEPEAADLCYLAARRPREPFELWRARPQNGVVPSLAHTAPLLGWYEREITDLCGVRFENHPEPRPLVLHEGAAPPCPPLHPRCPAAAPMPYTPTAPALLEVLGPDVQVLPFGPVRADVVESAQFLFSYIGEQILHYRPRLFFKHRGLEKRFEGHDPQAAVVLAERVSGVGSVTHALGYCQAVEAAAGTEVPRRVRLLRVLLAELERLYNHLHYLGHLADTTTLKVGQAEGKLLEERLKQINGRLTGSRFLRGLLAPGGLRRDLAPGPELARDLGVLRREAAAYVAELERTASYRDRLHDTGMLDARTAFDQGATGPVERASGLDRDLRRDHPYAAYEEMELRVPVETAGDAYARARVRVQEIEASFDLILRLLPRLPEGPVRVPVTVPGGAEGLGWAESPRGSLYYAVHAGADGRLARVKIKSPSFSNWRAFPHTVHDTNMMDYAINEASFGLTIAGCDR
jgi:formate hydrogenlyase subunit 5